jgi:lysozyme
MCNELRAELVRDEGCRLAAYKDTNGFWTIGVGHLLGNDVTPRVSRISSDEAMAWLEIDVRAAKAALVAVFPDWSPCACTHQTCEPDRVRTRALINMAFNRGETNMKMSTTITPAIRQAMKDGDWKPVTAAIAASPWARQIGARANRLAYMLENGEVMP